MEGANISQTESPQRHYIVVVHGIGDQKLNETTTPVVHRFAEVRNKKKQGHYQNLLPSYLSAQSVKQGSKGHGWSEFSGIPVVAPTDQGERKTNKFDGTPDSSGQNFRFVDIVWQDILKRHQERYASPVEQWGPALLARLTNHTPKKWLLPWVLPVMNSVVTVALHAKKALAFKFSDLTTRIFDGFLGDVHLYGDYTRTRGKAVRHLHVVLDEVMLRDFIDFCQQDLKRIERTEKEGGDVEPRPYHPPRFTLIAHSLGSIMSFDALVYARARDGVREAQGAEWNSCPSLPFLGYTYKAENVEDDTWEYFKEELKKLRSNKLWRSAYEERFPMHLDNVLDETGAPQTPVLSWRNQVTNFITLGSPIDKYHVMWWQNYLHMGLGRRGFTAPDKWRDGVDGWLDPSPDQKIRHYNFCDEQDPVGHHLDVARGTVNYGKIFDPNPVAQRDIVFRRYAKSGVAHVQYWDDKELFEGIVEKVIDNDGNTPYFLNPKFREGEKTYKQSLLWAYFRIPFLAALVTTLLVVYAWHGDTLIYRIAAGLRAILMWIQPNLIQAYQDEANPKGFDKSGIIQAVKTLPFIGRIRVKMGTLARLVAMMVEWRRIALRLHEGTQTSEENKQERVAFVGGNLKGWSFWWRWVYRLSIASAIYCLFIFVLPDLHMLGAKLASPDLVAIKQSATALYACYVGTMLFVAHQFVMAKYFRG